MKSKNHYNSISYSYVFTAKKRLELERTKKNNAVLGKMKNKWAAAAMVALASGSVVLFAPNGKAQAAEVDPNAKTEQVETKQDQGQTDVTKQDDKNVVVSDTKQNAEKTDTSVDGQKTNLASQNEQQKQGTILAEDDSNDSSEVVSDKSEKAENMANGKPVNTPDLDKGNVQGAWDQGYHGEGIAVAVIDSGVDTSHKDFQTAPKNPKFSKEAMEKIIAKLGHGGYVSSKFPYVHSLTNDDDAMKEDTADANKNGSHGQHIVGIIAAEGNSGTSGKDEYVTGVAPEAQVLFIKDEADDGADLSIAEGVYDAVKVGADVISISLGTAPTIQDLSHVNQKAIQYAIENGVVVLVSAGNDGNAASVDPNNHVKNKDNYYSNSNMGNYEPFNSGNIGSPAILNDAITVAAENSDAGDNDKMADFTSWGPTPDFTLKPDVSAPGVNIISTANGYNKYATMNGTSMATPFVSGVAALVVQRLKKTNPNLKGAVLVQAVKGLIMSTAAPLAEVDGDNNMIITSPRRQGAGKINAEAAIQSPVYITTDDGTSSLSLRKIGDSTSFNLIFHNLSDEDQIYNFDDLGGGYTELRDPDTGEFSDVQLAGARVNGKNTIVVKAGTTSKFKYTLNLTNLKKNQLIEGYLSFTSKNGQSDLAIPYLGYYGDMTNEDVFDKNANEDPDIWGNHFTNKEQYPRGIADEYSLEQLIKQYNKHDDFKWNQVAKLYESGKVAFSPNDDGKSDVLMPFAYLKQNIKDLKVEVLDSNGKVVRIITDQQNVAKSYYDNHAGSTTSIQTNNNDDNYNWDGKIYNSKTGKMEVAPDGQYTYRFVATLYNKGKHQVQTHDMPIIIDTTKPVFDSVNYDKQTHTLSGSYHDTGAGFTKYSYGTVTINDKIFGFKLNEGQNGFNNSDETAGHFNVVLNSDERAALAGTKNKVTVALSDAADNTVTKSWILPAVSGKSEITVWNAINGMPFDTNSDDYHKDDDNGDTYTLRGAADHDFYLDGDLITVKDGQFATDVYTDAGDIKFTSDKDGKHVLYTFTIADQDPNSPTATDDSGDDNSDNTGDLDSNELGNISFDNFTRNSCNIFTADVAGKAGVYNSANGEITVTGYVDQDKVSSLIAVIHGNSESDPRNVINFDKDGNFEFTFKIPKAGMRLIQYVYTTKDQKKFHGSIGASIDIVKPTINLKVPTIINKPVLHLSGVVNDNEDGYKVYIDGNNIFTQQNSNAVNEYPVLQSLNNYGPYDINYDINLNDNNGQPTDHIITVKVVDKSGNVTKRKYTVHYDPNYTGKPETTPGVDVPSAPVAPVQKEPMLPLTGSNTTDDQNDVITLDLTHNAFVYDGDGKIVVTPDGKNTLLEKGGTVSAWHQGKIVRFNGKDYVQVGHNAYIRLFNTLAKKLVVHNSYLYNAKGQATGKKGKLTVVKHGKYVYVWNNGQKFTINGKKFYRLVNGKFIKIANLQAVRAIKVTHHMARLYNEDGKLLKKHITLTKNKYYWAWNNAKVVKIRGKKYYRVGKDRYVRANKAVVANAKTAIDADTLK